MSQVVAYSSSTYRRMSLDRELASRLASAAHMIISDERVLDGTPVVEGTRVPVRDVAAMLEEASLAQVLRAFPMLSAHQIELCGLYAQAYLSDATSPERARPDLPMVAVERVRRLPPER